MSECRNALNQKTLFLCSLRKFVILLQRQDDLVDLLRKESQSAIVDKNPFLENSVVTNFWNKFLINNLQKYEVVKIAVKT